MTAIAILLGPIGRWLGILLVIASLLGGAYLKGRTDQRYVDDQAHLAELAKLSAETLEREQAAGKLAADVAAAHGAAVQQIQRDNDALRGQIRVAKLSATITPKEASNDPKKKDTPAAPQLVDVDDLVFGPDYLRLWNAAYGPAGQVVPGARQPGGGVPAPGTAPAGPPRWDQSARDSGPPHRRSGRLPDLQRPGGRVDSLVLRVAEVMAGR